MSIYTFHAQDPAVPTTDNADPTDKLLCYDTSTGKTSYMTHLQGQNVLVTTETTGATLAATGMSILASSVASNYLLNQTVVKGQRKIVTVPVATTVKKVMLSSTDGSITIGSSVNNVFAFSTVAVLDQTVELIAVSTIKWIVAAVTGSTGASSAFATSTST